MKPPMALLIIACAWFLDKNLEPTLAADKPARIVLELKGYITPSRQLTVSAKVPGQVVDLLIEEGQRVKAGDVLARLDAAEYEADLRLARVRLILAEAGLAKANEAAVKADVAIARAKVEVARAQFERAQQRRECTVVRAPVKGTVLTKRVEVGTLLNPRGGHAPMSVCDLADLEALEVDLWVPERDLAKVAKGQSCLIRLEAFPRTNYKGRVARLLPVADRAKGAVGVRVRVDVPAGDDQLRPELGAIVQFLANERTASVR